MKEIYYLNKETLPTICVPHDCVIKGIQIKGQTLTFLFEDDISSHDSIQAIRPNAKSLIIRYHLTEEDGFFLYEWKKPGRFFRKDGCYRRLDNSRLFSFAGHLEYLYHNVGYRSIIIKLFADDGVILDAYVDHLEYEWIE